MQHCRCAEVPALGIQIPENWDGSFENFVRYDQLKMLSKIVSEQHKILWKARSQLVELGTIPPGDPIPWIPIPHVGSIRSTTKMVSAGRNGKADYVQIKCHFFGANFN